MRKRPKVALLIESSRAYGRGLLRGIRSYVRTHGPWSIYFEPHGLGEPLPKWFSTWRGDGILARITDRHTCRAVLATGLPAIDLRGALPDTGVPLIGLDSRAAARMAFQHLRDRGFRHFAFCGAPRGQYRFLDQREDEFERIVREANCTFSCFPPHGEASHPANWEQDQSQLAEWISELPKPVGVMACHDDRGHELLNACRDVQIAVPDDVAVIGVDNDEVLCELSDPPLTSINSNTEEIGYRAAALLDGLMSKSESAPPVTLVEPLGVVARRSTDVSAIDDREVAVAMRYIREHACDGINVKDVLEQVSLSRSTLDRRFGQIIGRSPSDEITRVKFERVKQLLIETDYPLSRIADLAGFEHSEHMGVMFREKTGQTPGQFRKAQRR